MNYMEYVKKMAEEKQKKEEQAKKNKAYREMTAAFLKRIKNQKDYKVKTFKNWANYRKKIRSGTVINESPVKNLEQAFLEADPQKAPSTIKKIKHSYPLESEIQRAKNGVSALTLRRNLKTLKRNKNILEGRTTLPPLPKRLFLTQKQKKNIKTQGILGLRKTTSE